MNRRLDKYEASLHPLSAIFATWHHLKALEWCQAQGIAEVTLYFDYQGLESWATGAWRAKFPFTQYYARTVKASNITIHWIKVKAHSGNPENEIVDQLAKEGAMGQKVENERK
jgi:ribonuclease HI